MKRYLVMFVVQVEDSDDADHAAMNQGELYLNTGDRCVDFNVYGPIEPESGDPMPEIKDEFMTVPHEAELLTDPTESTK